MGKFTLEENLERIADALELIRESTHALAATQEHIRVLAEHVHIGRPMPGEEEDEEESAELAELEAVVEPAAAEPEAAAEEAPQWTYEALKAELIGRGATIPKGTKMTTLLRMWETYKDSEPAAAEPVEAVEPEVIAAEPTPEVVEAVEPEPAAAEAIEPEVVAEPVEAVEPAKPMTAMEARQCFMDMGYTGSVEQRGIMRKALASVGKERFADLADGEFEKVIEAYKSFSGELF
jgi:hypothetical protein